MFTPQLLFGEVGSSPDILAHEPFLERARLQREQERDASARLALGGYVVARLVDRLRLLKDDSEAHEAFRWQREAVRRHLHELPSDAPEAAHLSGVVAAVPEGGPPGSALWKSLVAYAYFLEHEGRMEESLEVLTLAALSQGPETPVEDFTAYALFAGRLNRRLAKWEVARACYGAAEEAGAEFGDSVSMLRGRLGRGLVLRGQGNFPAARVLTEGVLHEATRLGLTEVQAMAYADLGVVYTSQGLRLEALEAEYQAFQLSCDTPQQMRALGNLAVGLAEIGALEAARLAFRIVTNSDASVEVRANALIELMDLESSLGNRVAFERYRSAAEEYRNRMPPSMAVDYHYKMGLGLARFGQASRAHASLTTALELSELHRLNAWYFKVERSLKGLAEHNDEQLQPRQVSALSEAPIVREMEIGLRHYAALAAT